MIPAAINTPSMRLFYAPLGDPEIADDATFYEIAQREAEYSEHRRAELLGHFGIPSAPDWPPAKPVVKRAAGRAAKLPDMGAVPGLQPLLLASDRVMCIGGKLHSSPAPHADTPPQVGMSFQRDGELYDLRLVRFGERLVGVYVNHNFDDSMARYALSHLVREADEVLLSPDKRVWRGIILPCIDGPLHSEWWIGLRDGITFEGALYARKTFVIAGAIATAWVYAATKMPARDISASIAEMLA